MSSVGAKPAASVVEPIGEPRLGCDQLLGSGRLYVHSALQLTGWAVAGSGIAAIEVDIGERTLLASYGLPSPDIADLSPDAASARFELRLDPHGLARGVHPLVIRARSRTGEAAELSGTLHVEPYVPTSWHEEDQRDELDFGRPTMSCETDASPDRKFRLPGYIRGWAHAPDGISRVSVFIAGTQRHEATIGLPRTDLMPGLGGRVVDAGFRLLLEPDAVPEGRHAVVVIAYPNAGEPVGTSAWLNFAGPAGGWEPRPLDESELEESGERFVPERHRETTMAIEHQARYLWAAGLVRGRRVLDAGCGVGWGTALLASGGPAAVTGVDYSPSAIKYARQHYGTLAEFLVADMRELDFPDESFDLVVCFEAIEHVEDPFSALDHFRRILTPEGQMLISTPVKGVYPEGNPFHIHEFAAGELEASLARRFNHVRAHRQRSHAATLLIDDAATSVSEVSMPIQVLLHKNDGVAPGQEMYTVAAASDGPLPPAPHIAVLGDALDFKRLQDARRVAEERARAADERLSFEQLHTHSTVDRDHLLSAQLRLTESELERLRAAHDTDQQRAGDAERRLAQIAQSRSWRWARPLRRAAGWRRRLEGVASQPKNP